MLLVITCALVSVVLLGGARAIYNLFFHPLAKFPGPKLWIAFPVLRWVSALRGKLDWEILEAHEKYGEVVRYSNDELSFTTASAWKDIYGHGHKQLPKVVRQEPDQPRDIISSNDADHARYRKSVAYGFSEKGLQAQEILIKAHVDKLICNLKEDTTAGRPTDLTMFYNLTTFDIISDIAFGKSFDCLKKRAYNDYIIAMFRYIMASHLVSFSNLYPLLWNCTLRMFYGSSVKKARSTSRQLASKTALERIHDSEKVGRGDLMDHMLRHRGQKDGLEDVEIAINANVLFIAGSETTATLLSGATYWLLQTPEALRKATDEVRAVFKREEEIDFSSASQRLPYLLAVLNEGLRRYPPVPTALSRITSTPTDISGYMVPPKTKVAVHQMSAYWSPTNFHRPKEFIPERWLPEASEDPSSPFYNDNRAVLQPFSVGPRNCVGRNLAYKEMRLILARILWNFDLALLEGDGSGDNVDWESQRIFILWEKKPLMCTLRNRNDI